MRALRRPDRRLRVHLVLEALLVYGALLGVLAATGAPARAWAAALLVILAPLLGLPAQRFVERSERIPALAIGLVWALQLAPLTLLASVESVLPALLGFLQGHLLLRASRDGAASASIALGPVQAIACMAAAPAEGWLLVFPAALLAAASSLLLLQARAADRRSSNGGDGGRAGEAGEEPALSGLTVYALPLTAALLLAIPFVYLVVLVLPAPVLHPGSTERGAAASVSDPGGDEVETPFEADRREAFEQIFPSSVELGGGVTQLVHQTVMRVRPLGRSSGGRATGPFYLRGMVLDRFDAAGASFAGGGESELRGAAGGWVPLERRVGPAPVVELEIVQQPVFLERERSGILFAPSPTLAIALEPPLERVRFDPGGLLVVPNAERLADPADESRWFRFRCRVQESRAALAGVGDARARHPDRGYVQLPSRGGRAELAEIRSIARDVVDGAANDRERVGRLTAFFREEFTYSLRATEFPGLPGVLEFLRRREGPCTAYASTAVLMLRSLGIPARIATGFVAQELDPEGSGEYVVTTREGHAWIEVHFEGHGWITFDPTPPDQRAALLAAGRRPAASSGLAAWTGEVVLGLRRWASSGGDLGPARDVAAALLDAPRALRSSVRRAPLSFGLGAGALALLVLLRLARRRSGGSADAAARPRAAADPVVESLYRRLLAALAGLGFEKRPSQTPREFAAAVVGAPGADAAALGPLRGVTETLYRARFGGEPLSGEEAGRVEALIRRCAELRAREPG